MGLDKQFAADQAIESIRCAFGFVERVNEAEGAMEVLEEIVGKIPDAKMIAAARAAVKSLVVRLGYRTGDETLTDEEREAEWERLLKDTDLDALENLLICLEEGERPWGT